MKVLQRSNSSFFCANVEARWSVVDSGVAGIALKERLSTVYADLHRLKTAGSMRLQGITYQSQLDKVLFLSSVLGWKLAYKIFGWREQKIYIR